MHTPNQHQLNQTNSVENSGHPNIAKLIVPVTNLKCAHEIQCLIEIAPSHGEYVDIYQQVIDTRTPCALSDKLFI